MTYSRPSTPGPEFSHQPERQLQVVVHAGPLAGKGFPITKETITFGRDPENDISWDDSQVSRRHARLTRQGNQLILEDLGSTNGTLVNGKSIEGEHFLQPADIISIGTSIFGVKGFSAPNTLGVTQLSMQPPPATLPPRPAPAPRPAPPSSKPRVPARPAPTPAASGPSKLSMLALGGILALIIIVLSLAVITAVILFGGDNQIATQAPVVVITAPANGATVPLNLPLTVQATASDPSGVIRLELWVNGVNTAEAVSPAAQGQPTLTASLQWIPVVPGSHRLEVKAYNVQDVVSQAASVTVTVVDGTDQQTPTPTPIPGTPTATVPTQPALTTLTDLNVRSGPDTTAYEVIGLLPSGTTAEIIGRDESRQWWQIRFDPAPNDVGWVTSDPNFSRAVNVENIPVAAPPPTPTSTPTNTPTPIPTATPIPPTQTATSTSIPPTQTPTLTPTPTATSAATQIDFDISPTVIQGGQCVAVSWNVVGVKEVYYQGEGVAGIGSRTECPNRTTTYTLRVIKLDDTEQAENITVEVINPVSSSGSVTLDPDETIDFDEGAIPGDDFWWYVEDGTRRFEAQEGVQLSPKGQLQSLEELTLAECAGSAYGTYTYIDASDEVADPANALLAGRAACYRTDEGRLGKLRFPDYSTGPLRVEWLTWR